MKTEEIKITFKDGSYEYTPDVPENFINDLSPLIIDTDCNEYTMISFPKTIVRWGEVRSITPSGRRVENK